jgi:hypothetical protein
MANALTSDGVSSQINAIHQFLHGYSDGHRLIEGSLKLPNDLTRLMLRMSDLSGSSVVKSFENYLTGYPLDSVNGYALAMTWYASEMPRPGSVWTHTLALPAQTMAAIPSLGSLIHLFKRPSRDSVKGQYAETLSFHNVPINNSHPRRPIDALGKLSSLFSAYYQRSPSSPIVVVARSSDEFADTIFALWSQQWPSLRQQFAFCTGSLSARNLPDRPFDIQCSPPTLAKDVAREAATDVITEPTVSSDQDDSVSNELRTAVEDAAMPDGGAFRRYLWTVTDANSRRTDFVSYARIFDALDTKTEAARIVELIAQAFPEPTAGSGLKMRLMGSRHTKPLSMECAEQDVLLVLATTERHSSFDIGSALNDELAARLFAESPDRTRRLVADLFRSNLNPFGDDLLTTLVRAMDVNDAQEVVSDQPQFLPAFFRVNADLAASAELWSMAGDRRHELMDSLVAQEIRPELVGRIVAALLDSGSDGFLRRAFERWGKDAVFAALDWTEEHQGSMPETCRQALTFQVPSVMNWIESGSRSTPALIAAAHVVAPYCYQISKHDSSVWRRAYHEIRESDQHEEATYLETFLLGLALRNAPPAPLDLIGECFEAIHRKVSRQQLRYDTWLILEPLVPQLSWRKNWDKCERIRRGLLLAFMQNSWPAWEIRERIRDRELLRQILKSVRKVHGEDYFYDICA